MQIKNILVDDKELYINLIIEELCKNNIHYVYIKDVNELHFDNYIFRFYDKNNIFIILENDAILPPIKGFEPIIEVSKTNEKKLRPNYKNNINSNKTLKKVINNRNYFRRYK